MMVCRNRQVQELLKETMEMGCLKKIYASHDVGDSLESIVSHYCEVIARADVFSHEDRIPEEIGPGRDSAAKRIMPVKIGAGDGEGLFQIEAQGVGEPGGYF